MLKFMNDGSTNESAARDGALYYFRTNGDYIFKGVGNEFRCIYSSLSLLVTLQSGEGVCGGRHITEKKIGNEDTQITLPANAAGYLVIRFNGDSVGLYCTSVIEQGDLNNGDTVRDLPLYAYVTGANNILSFVDMRPISRGNGFVLRMEEGELYAYFNGRRKKIATKEVL